MTVRSIPLPSAGWNPAPMPQSQSSAGAALSLPKELWRIVDAIYRNGLTEKDLFIQPGGSRLSPGLHYDSLG